MAPMTRSRMRKPLADPGAGALADTAGSFAAGGGDENGQGHFRAAESAIGISSGEPGPAFTATGVDPHPAGPGGSLNDLCRLQYDADGEPAAAHDHVHVHAHRRRADQPSSRQELGSCALLVLLYMVQGVPLGLTTGALPFMLSSKLSYTQMGIFALASYPYSLKLLWSPIVDSLYSRRLGRRKSWILPIQLLTAYLLIACADWIQDLYEQAEVGTLTLIFTFVVFLMATQDIAVDGWALTLLSPANVSYASTCQTVGQTTGIFTSFTVFLALQDAAFCNRFIRSNPLLGRLLGSQPSDSGLVSLAGYMRFWGWTFAAVTAFIALAVREGRGGAHNQQQPHQPDGTRSDPRDGEDAATAPLNAEDRAILGFASEGDDGSGARSHGAGRGQSVVRRRRTPAAAGTETAVAVTSADTADGVGGGGRSPGRVAAELREAYLQLWRVVRLPAVLRLSALLLSYRVGVLAAEGAASLKLIDKGVAKEALAFLVLFQFPLELLSAVIAGRWAASHSPYWPFITGYWLRLATAAATVAVTAVFPPGATSLAAHRGAFGWLAAVSLATSFVSYLGFTAQGSFFNTVSDPSMGGAYLTLLNTIANMGFMLPRTPLFWAMDVLTVARCYGVTTTGGTEIGVPPLRRQILPYTCPKKMLDMARRDSECAAAGGECGLASDGYYLVSGVSLVVGAALGLMYVRFVWTLMRQPLASWRATGGGEGGGGRGAGGAGKGEEQEETGAGRQRR